MSLSESTKIKDIFSNLKMKIQLVLIIKTDGRTKCSLLIKGDSDRLETEIDFGFGMKNLMFEPSLIRPK